jgi:beta-1,4-mannosyltransferase
MEGRTTSRTVSPAAFVTDLLAAARYAEGLGHDRPIVLAYFPPVPINPYQALLYRRTLASGIAPVPMGTLDGLDPMTNVAPSLVANGVTPALHLHWLNRITRNATDEAHAQAEVQAFLARLDAFAAVGGRLVWTAHNVLPHDSRYPAADTVLRQGLADRAALVHVVAGGTAEAIGDRYTLPPPERVVHVPHPSYRGAYPEGPDRDQARLTLGLTPDELVYAFVGAIRPYKGLAALLEAFDDVSTDGRPRRLLVAGNPDKSAAVEAAIDACLAHPNVLLTTGLLPPEELAVILRAADIAVLPYRDALNSGVLMLALTFGLPVVAPAIPGVTELVDERVAATFQPGEPRALADALRRADQLPGDAATARALEIAAAHDPDTLSERFGAAVRAALTPA